MEDPRVALQPAFNTYVDKGDWNALVPAKLTIRFPAGH